MNKLKQFARKLWNDESGQGATEYILLLVVIVAIATIFGEEIKSAVQEKISQVGGQIGGFE